MKRSTHLPAEGYLRRPRFFPDLLLERRAAFRAAFFLAGFRRAAFLLAGFFRAAFLADFFRAAFLAAFFFFATFLAAFRAGLLAGADALGWSAAGLGAGAGVGSGGRSIGRGSIHPEPDQPISI